VTDGGLSPALLAASIFLWVWTMGFLIAAMYLGGGAEAIRHQSGMLVLVAVGSVVALAAVAILPAYIGDAAWFLVLIGANVVVLGWNAVASRRRPKPPPPDPERIAKTQPARRVLVVLYIAGLVVMVVAITQATRIAA
jgi:hypothetical protein